MSVQQLAVVTGGSSGIGLELARQFARHGHDLVIGGQDAAKLEGAAALLRRETGRPNGKKDEIVALLETGNGKR